MCDIDDGKIFSKKKKHIWTVVNWDAAEKQSILSWNKELIVRNILIIHYTVNFLV